MIIFKYNFKVNNKTYYIKILSLVKQVNLVKVSLNHPRPLVHHILRPVFRHHHYICHSFLLYRFDHNLK